MRIINADEVTEKLKMAAEPYTINTEDHFADDFVDGLGMAYCIISNTPTVDAITYEWIKTYVKQFEYENDEYWAIIRMITEWEKRK